MPSHDELVEIKVDIIAYTSRSLFVSTGSIDAWLPLSHVVGEIRYIGEGKAILTIPKKVKVEIFGD